MSQDRGQALGMAKLDGKAQVQVFESLDHPERYHVLTKRDVWMLVHASRVTFLKTR